MLKRIIPSSGEEIGAVGLGTYQSFDTRLTSINRPELMEVLSSFFAAGGSVIDSSPMYGRAEAVIGELLAELNAHERAWLTTKVWTRGKEKGIRKMEASFAKLRCAHMPLMQVHNLLDCRTHLETLQSWRADGRIRYIGITHYTASALDDLAEYLKQGGIDFVQFPYSIADRAAEEWFLPLCADLGIATLINRPLEKGSLINRARGDLPGFAVELGITSWAAYFLKYVLADPAVTCVIPATSNPVHMLENLSAGDGDLPDANLRQMMVDEIIY